MKNYLIFILLIPLFGCASQGVTITKNNNNIEKPLYSISIPPDQGWQMYKDDNNPDGVFFVKILDSASYYAMRFGTNWIADESMKTWTAEQIADEYRNYEKQDMINRGVNTGKYELKDVVFGSEVIEGKKFYTMNYVTLHDESVENASLYIYFPRDKNISDFVIALYSETHPRNETLTKSAKNEFTETLRSLDVRM
jgi:hypothetical protein